MLFSSKSLSLLGVWLLDKTLMPRGQQKPVFGDFHKRRNRSRHREERRLCLGEGTKIPSAYSECSGMDSC